MDSNLFAKNIKKLRNSLNLTQDQFAKRLNLTDKAVSKWERGESIPDLSMIRHISDVFKVPLNSLIDYKDLDIHKKNVTKHFKNFAQFILTNFIKIVFIISFVILLIFFINNYNTVNFYYIKNNDTNVTIDNGFFIDTKEKTIFILDHINLHNINYEIVTINTKLYTVVNGDRFDFYESDNLECILIEELHGYNEIFTKEVIESVKKGIYIEINILDTDHKVHTYKTKFDIVKNFSNNKLFYSLTDKKVDVSTEGETMKEIENKLTEVQLLNKGFNKNEELDCYIKESKYITYMIYTKLNRLNIHRRTTKKTFFYTIFYDTYDYKVIISGKTGNVLSKYDFNKKSDSLTCYEGNCDNYKDDIKYIDDELAFLLD